MRSTVSNIYKILKYCTWDTAKEQLSKLCMKWDSYTINQVLKTHPPMEKAWLFFNWALSLKGFKHDQFTYTTMLDIFGEAGRIESMNFLFKQLQEKGIKIDAVSYTSIMQWVSRSGDVDGTVKIWEEMKENGCFPTVVSFTAYMKIMFDSKKVKEAIDVYKKMLESGISPNCHTYTVLMEYLVADWIHPDKAACNILIERCCKAGETDTMSQILQHMRKNQLTLRYPVFLEALRTLKIAGESDALVVEVNSHCATEIINFEDAPEFTTFTANDPLDRGCLLILLRKQNLAAVDCLLAEVMDKNMLLDSWIVSTIIVASCSNSRTNSALLALEYSVRMGIELERTAYLTLVGILIRSNTFLRIVEIVKEMIRAGHSLGLYLGALLIYRLGSARRPSCAANILIYCLMNRSAPLLNTAMISVYFSAGSPDKALKIYGAMKMKGISPSIGTYDILLSGLQRNGRICETDAYRKEKKSWIAPGYCWNSVLMDEKMCDLLFAGGLVS